MVDPSASAKVGTSSLGWCEYETSNTQRGRVIFRIGILDLLGVNGHLLRQKLERDPILAMDALHKQLGRAPSYNEMKAELIDTFDHVAIDSRALKMKFNKLSWDDKTPLSYLLSVPKSRNAD